MAPACHVIFGTGPVGCWAARALREREVPVRAVNRTDTRPDLMPADVEMVEEACRVLGVETRLGVVSAFMMRIAGLFVPAARASVEMMYQFTAPFVVGSSRMERELGLSATPVASGIERTMSWYRARLARR